MTKYVAGRITIGKINKNTRGSNETRKGYYNQLTKTNKKIFDIKKQVSQSQVFL